MKKYLFAAQVFGLSAMFPVTAFLELNHGARNFAENIPVTGEIAKIGKPSDVLHNIVNEKTINETVTITLQTILLKAF